MDEALVEFLTELLKASPYAVLLVLAFVLFFFMHRNSVKEIREGYAQAIKEIRLAYNDSANNIFKMYETVKSD